MKPSLNKFSNTIWSHYRKHKRAMPWRDNPSPYNVVASEIMLQQTQVSRVIPKFTSFTARFPDWHSLASARTSSVLREWSGLGYNRRALYLQRIAAAVVSDERYRFLQLGNKDLQSTSDVETPQIIFSRKLSRTEVPALQGWDRAPHLKYFAGPDTSLINPLLQLPGIGPNTAGSILAFAYNTPIAFIETNIRAVFIHAFFQNSRSKIPDTKLLPLIAACLQIPKNKKNPREWYYALMDYGAHLKTITENPSRKSMHHVKQTPFKGSNRELRANILKTVMKRKISREALVKLFVKENRDVEKIRKNIADLEKEGFFKL